VSCKASAAGLQRIEEGLMRVGPCCRRSASVICRCQAPVRVGRGLTGPQTCGERTIGAPQWQRVPSTKRAVIG